MKLASGNIHGLKLLFDYLRRHFMPKNIFICVISAMILFLMYRAEAQYNLNNSVFSNGGVPISSGSYMITSTVGQSAIGFTQGTSYQHPVGFWYGVNIYVGIAGEEDLLPKKFELYQNYPNPFNPLTHIKYAVPHTSRVRIEIYNVLGQRVRTLLDEEKVPGWYTVNFDASSLASGFYIYRMQAEAFADIRKMIVTK